MNLVWRTVRYLLAFPIWGDEAFVAVNLLNRDYWAMVEPLEYGTIVPIGFMWLELAAAQAFGLGEWALRLVPYLAGLLSVFLFWKLSRTLLSGSSTMLAVAFFTASYYPVRHAAELKPYSFDLLLAVGLVLAAIHLLRGIDSIARWAALTMLAVISVWFSYPSVFVSGGIGLALAGPVLRRSSRQDAASASADSGTQPVIPWLVYGAFLCASFGVSYMIVGRPQAAGASWTLDSWGHAFPPLDVPSRIPGWLLYVHTGRLLAYPNGSNAYGSAGTLLLVCVGALVLWRARRRAIVAILLSPLLLNLVAAAMKKYPYGTSARISLFMAPAFCLLAGFGLSMVLSHLAPKRRRIGRVIVVAFMFMVALVGTLRDLVEPYKRRADLECRNTSQWLATQVEPADRIVIFNALEPRPYAPDLSRWGGSGARFRFNLERFLTQPKEWAPDPSELTFDQSDSHDRVWLIAYRDIRSPFPQDQLDAFRSVFDSQLSLDLDETFDLGHLNEAIHVYRYRPSDY